MDVTTSAAITFQVEKEKVSIVKCLRRPKETARIGSSTAAIVPHNFVWNEISTAGLVTLSSTSSLPSRREDGWPFHSAREKSARPFDPHFLRPSRRVIIVITFAFLFYRDQEQFFNQIIRGERRKSDRLNCSLRFFFSLVVPRSCSAVQHRENRWSRRTPGPVVFCNYAHLALFTLISQLFCPSLFSCLWNFVLFNYTMGRD